MTPYVDFHTHDLSWDQDIFRLNSISLNEINKNIRLAELKNPFTIGVHPWDVGSMSALSETLDRLAECLQHPLCVGMGEMGLDRARPENYDQQQVLFDAQVRLAKDLNTSWIVLHCVRAQNDILKIFKDKSFKGRAVFHDFNGSLEEGRHLRDLGHVVSLGAKILNPKTKAHQWLQQEVLSPSDPLPWGQFFLETDAGGVSIVELYENLSQWAGRPVDELKSQFFTHLPSEFYKF